MARTSGFIRIFWLQSRGEHFSTIQFERAYRTVHTPQKKHKKTINKTQVILKAKPGYGIVNAEFLNAAYSAHKETFNITSEYNGKTVTYEDFCKREYPTAPDCMSDNPLGFFSLFRNNYLLWQDSNNVRAVLNDPRLGAEVLLYVFVGALLSFQSPGAPYPLPPPLPPPPFLPLCPSFTP